ncbi:MAG: RNA methyltransferase [Pseudomonadota bacterium]
MKKPAWVVEKERKARAEGARTLWLFGLHAVRDALANPRREKLRLVLTRNAADRLGDAVAAGGLEPELADPRKFPVPLDPGSVHQGAALEVRPLDWGRLEEVCDPGGAPGKATGRATGKVPGEAPRLLLLDRVTDPHNVGAILRSAEVFGARAVIAPSRHAAPETGALAKTASGALERQPYLRVPNLGDAMLKLRDMGYVLVGLDGEGADDLGAAAARHAGDPLALALGAEGPGLRARTRELCDTVVRIEAAGAFGSLNVSNAAAVALYATRKEL